MFRYTFTICLTLIVISPVMAEDFDVVIYGGTSAAVTAAVQSKKMGKSVVIVCPDKHLGGLSSGGLGWTDTGNKAVIGGLAREFYHRVWKKYQEPDAWKQQTREQYGNKGQGTAAIDGAQRTMWIFEPHVAEAVFDGFVKDYDIPVHRDEWLDREEGVELRDGKIRSVKMLSGKSFTGKMFIDATYEGDLLAAANIDFHVGRESTDTYGEKWNGVQAGVLHHSHWFKEPVDPYVVKGDPSSGLLPRISGEDPGNKGEEDHRVQAYCFRMCLTNDDSNRIPFPKPAGYDPFQYELMVRVFESGWRQSFGKFDPIPNKKTDTNNHGPFSTDNIGYNYEYPNGSYEKRKEIIAEHEQYQKGLMYFLANDPRVPDEIRTKMATWGLPKDEFTDNGNWPHQIYVREARRMIGKYVMTEQDCLHQRTTPEPVGMGSYTMDSHNVQRYVKPDGFVQNEGDIGVGTPPYQISYGSLVPKENQCQNLLVPVCISSSHIAFGSIRMEPVFMILGQSAATAASMAIDDQVSIQKVSYLKLQEKLTEDGQVLEYDGPVKVGHGRGIDAKSLKGIVVDSEDLKVSSDWISSGSTGKFVGHNYFHDDNKEKGQRSFTFDVKLPKPGKYEVRLGYSANGNRASNVPVTISTKAGDKTVQVNQKKPGEFVELFTSLGEFEFDQPSTKITISNTETDGHVIVDAVQLIPAK
ncbi:MAG: FAD-dependent oxidoreductase [Planctomicrobium sp.]|jgi:hypothetical protein|nr:FAD-dependent oxidoreductase [Planctomicrobium sp.]